MKQINILIIDDEKKLASMLSKRLSLRDLNCEACYNGISGIEAVEKYGDRIELILLDLQLPDMYGTEVLQKIKQINPSLPVAIITGHGSPKDSEECFRLGAVEFINKPVRIDQIIDILTEIKK